MGDQFIVLDIATAPLPNAAEFIDLDAIQAPSNYKDPEKIAAYVAEKRHAALLDAALDPDLCRISAFAWWCGDDDANVATSNVLDETEILRFAASQVHAGATPMKLVSYNGLKFDWPVLNARARYLGVRLDISLDAYRSPHIDLYDKLTNHGKLSGHSLAWWCKRLGWSDLLKPLSGAEEAKVFETGRWDELSDSLRHDVEATRRLAQWMGVLS